MIRESITASGALGLATAAGRAFRHLDQQQKAARRERGSLLRGQVALVISQLGEGRHSQRFSE